MSQGILTGSTDGDKRALFGGLFFYIRKFYSPFSENLKNERGLFFMSKVKDFQELVRFISEKVSEIGDSIEDLAKAEEQRKNCLDEMRDNFAALRDGICALESMESNTEN